MDFRKNSDFLKDSFYEENGEICEENQFYQQNNDFSDGFPMNNESFYAEESQFNRDFTGNDEYVRENLQNDEMIPVSDKIKFVKN